jgi:hypothetical protein
MPYLVGIVLSLGVALFATSVGFDRDRAFYPTVLIAAVAGFKASPWIVVGALAGHGVLDVFHGNVVENSGVPVWWPAFCLAYDLGAAGSLAWLIKRRPRGLPA